jgi:cytochrome bd-type quinol oxidase subunit 2
MDLIRLLVVCLLVAIVASLGSALYQLSSSKGDSRRMLRALSIRVALSIALFALLMLAWWAGLITPRGVAHQ